MTIGPEDPEGREDRLAEIVAGYLEQMAVGGAGPPTSLVARHPEFAEELTEFFAVRGRFEAAVQPLRAAMAGGERADHGLDRAAADGAGRLGDFRLLREVGRGGMGIVYEAEQISLGRRVALKVLPLAATLDPRQLQRFKNEALAAAALDHPHVVDVYGVGCERGTHYYAMRFIDGHSLAEVVDQLRRLGRSDGRSLPDSVSRAFAPGTDPAAGPERPTAAADTGAVAAATTRRSSFPRSFFRSVAEVGMRVAEALDHAHQQGVVHRDVKPSNLLLDAQGKVWVADFGLARFEAAASLTGTGGVVGTLRYMAPEQARGRPTDHRCDVYGLGATLYELLTLQPAFPGGDREELLRQITSAEPPGPRRLDRSIPPDLETVVLKAMAKDPDERYPTARALADDLRRFLEDRPIQARRPGPVVRLRRWGRRHRPAVLGTGAGLVLLLVVAVAGLAVSTVLINRERAKVQRQHEEAEAARRKARTKVDQMTRVAQERLLDAPHMESVRQELLQYALDFYKESLAEQGDDPTMRQEAALAHGRLGNIQRYLGRTVEAEQNLRRAIDMLEAEPALRPDARGSLGEFYYCLGGLLQSVGRGNESAPVFERSVTMLENLRAEFPGELEYQEQLASSYVNLANTVLSNRPGDAEALLRRVIALTEADGYRGHGHVLGHAALGALLARTGRLHDAERAYRRALEIEETRPADLARGPSFRHRIGSLYLNLGGLLAAMGRSDEAERTYGRALASCDKLAADFPAVPYYRGYLAATHSALGDLLKAGGRTRHAEAETAYRAALAIYQKLRAEFPNLPGYGRQLLANRIQLGQVLVRAGRLDESRETVGEAVSLQARLGPVVPGELGYLPELARSYLDLGHLMAADGRKDEADDAYQAAVAVQEKAEAEFAGKPDARHDLARSHVEVARLLHSVERVEDEEKLRRWALAHYQKLVEDEADRTEYRDELARVWLALGTLLRKTGRLPEAEKACRQAVDHFAKLPDQAEHRQALAHGHNLLGVILKEGGQRRDAEPAFEKSITLWEGLAKELPKHRAFRHQEANARNNFGYLLTETGRAGQAEPHHRKALELFDALTSEDRDSPSYADGRGMSLAGLGAVHFAAGRLKEAEDTIRQSVALYRELGKSRPRPWTQFKLAEELSHLGLVLTAAGRHAEAVQTMQEALAIQEKLTADGPKVPRYRQAVGQSHNSLAWLLATCPDAKVRDPQRALKLAERAVELAPKERGFWNTLGVARYRAGDSKGAIAALEKSMELGKGGDAFDWYFLAMAHHELGRADEARKWFDRAVAWMEKNKERLEKNKLAGEELRRFRAEAEARLDKREPKPR